MGWFSDKEEQHNEVFNDKGGYNPPEEHKGKLSHELIAGAASFEGLKVWEDSQRKEGKTVNHAFAKEALAGFIGAEAEKFVEKHALNQHDANKVKQRAVVDGEEMYQERYGQQKEFDPKYRPGSDGDY